MASDPQNSSLLSNILCIEFLGARLSPCSGLLRLGENGLIYYASRTGDSYVLQILAEKQPDSFDPKEVNPNFNQEIGFNDRPYLKILEEHQSLAPVMDLSLRSQHFGESYGGMST